MDELSVEEMEAIARSYEELLVPAMFEDCARRMLEAAPPDVTVVEVEPAVEEFGHEFTPEVRRGAEEARRKVRRLALGLLDPATLPRAPLGGFGSGNGSPATDGPEAPARSDGQEQP